MNKIGVLIGLRADTDIAAEFKKAKDIGCECCQLTVWDMSLYTDEKAEELIRASQENDIEISTLWTGWSGPKEWNFTGGPMTLGIVPESYRMKRTEEILQGADFAVKLVLQANNFFLRLQNAFLLLLLCTALRVIQQVARILFRTADFLFLNILAIDVTDSSACSQSDQ